MADGDAAGREDRRAVGELVFVAGGPGSFVPLQRQILRPGFGDKKGRARFAGRTCFHFGAVPRDYGSARAAAASRTLYTPGIVRRPSRYRPTASSMLLATVAVSGSVADMAPPSQERRVGSDHRLRRHAWHRRKPLPATRRLPASDSRPGAAREMRRLSL